MIGDIEAAFAASRSELDDMRLPGRASGSAVDLGAGFGLHGIPLAERGYAVTAIDTCTALLDEMRARSGALPVTAVDADLRDFRSHVQGPVDLILCMGDTLTHLPDLVGVQSLLTDAADSLRRGGMFAATFRDYASRTLEGDQRFILVRADDDRILTCFLEYDADHVTVHDLLQDRTEGQWRQRVSSYRKLRLPPAFVQSGLAERGFSVRLDTTARGMTRIIGIKGG